MKKIISHSTLTNISTAMKYDDMTSACLMLAGILDDDVALATFNSIKAIGGHTPNDDLTKVRYALLNALIRTKVKNAGVTRSAFLGKYI